VHLRPCGVAGRRRSLRWAHGRQELAVRRRRDVHLVHKMQACVAVGRPGTPPPAWLDHAQRHLIAPLALWDITDQLLEAAERFRRITGR
jgi:hypothetical protein